MKKFKTQYQGEVEILNFEDAKEKVKNAIDDFSFLDYFEQAYFPKGNDTGAGGYYAIDLKTGKSFFTEWEQNIQPRDFETKFVIYSDTFTHDNLFVDEYIPNDEDKADEVAYDIAFECFQNNLNKEEIFIELEKIYFPEKYM